eukprot:850628-Rhodomonas_salina.1
MQIKKYLTEQAVLEIFAARPRPGPASGVQPTKHQLSLNLAQKYGVTYKTIQQIWNRKCWTKLTEPFWEEWERTDATSSQPAGQPSKSDCSKSVSSTDGSASGGGRGPGRSQDQMSTSSEGGSGSWIDAQLE